MTDEFLKLLCPEAVFTPEYPQVFKFDLIIGSENFGKLEIRIDKDLELSELKGDKKTLDKLEEIGKNAVSKKFYYCSLPNNTHYVSYPFKNAADLCFSLMNTYNLKSREIGDLKHFVSKVLHPIDEEILYEKKGIHIDF